MRRATGARPGSLSGFELEFPVTADTENLSAAEAIALESALMTLFIDRWNTLLGETPELANKKEFFLERQEVHVPPEDVVRMHQDYEAFLKSIPDANNHYPEIVEGARRLSTLLDTGFTCVIANGGFLHPDNHFLAEIAAPPFSDPFSPESCALASLLERTIAAVNREFQGAQMHTHAAAPYGTYAQDKYSPLSSHKAAIPGADTPVSVMLLTRHLGPLKNPRISNDGAGMGHGGQHVTVGLGDPKRLGDALRVLAGLTPTLMVLTENNGMDDRFPVRLLHGSWLGQNPGSFPRMGNGFFDPNLPPEGIMSAYWENIFASPIIIELDLDAEQRQWLLRTVHPDNFGKTVAEYMEELWQRYGGSDGPGADDPLWEEALRAQSKVWGTTRIREIPQVGADGGTPEILIEYRALDTQRPDTALVIQAIIQSIAQDSGVLDRLMTHLESLDVIPQCGKSYSPEDLQAFERDLRETALRALTGRTGRE